MESIAGILGDSQLSALWEKYGEISHEDDSAETEAAAETDDAVSEAVDPQSEILSQPAAENLPIVLEAGAENAEHEVEKPKKVTYKELREKILMKFLERSEQLMAEKEDAKSESSTER